MNERIKELTELADKFAKENKAQTITGPGNNYFEIFHEKFAELIVRECIKMVENEAAQYVEPVWAVELVNDMHEHFGVEE